MAAKEAPQRHWTVFEGSYSVPILARAKAPEVSGIKPNWFEVIQKGSGPPVERAPINSNVRKNSFILNQSINSFLDFVHDITDIIIGHERTARKAHSDLEKRL